MSQFGRGDWRKRIAHGDHQHALRRETQAGASSMNGRWPPVAHGATAETSASPTPAAYAQMCVTPGSGDDSTPNRAGTAYAQMCITPSDSGDGPGGSASSSIPGGSWGGHYFEAYRSYRSVTPSDVKRAQARSPADDVSKLSDRDFAAESEVLSQISQGLDSDPKFQGSTAGQWSFANSDNEDDDGNGVEDNSDGHESDERSKFDEDGSTTGCPTKMPFSSKGQRTQTCTNSVTSLLLKFSLAFHRLNTSSGRSKCFQVLGSCVQTYKIVVTPTRLGYGVAHAIPTFPNAQSVSIAEPIT